MKTVLWMFRRCRSHTINEKSNEMDLLFSGPSLYFIYVSINLSEPKKIKIEKKVGSKLKIYSLITRLSTIITLNSNKTAIIHMHRHIHMVSHWSQMYAYTR